METPARLSGKLSALSQLLKPFDLLKLCAAGLRHGMKGSGGDILEPIALPLLISLNLYYAQIE
ncbi:hypothetical protein ACV8X1_03665 [Salmonella enterica subsp. enterica serovar Typhi]